MFAKVTNVINNIKHAELRLPDLCTCNPFGKDGLLSCGGEQYKENLLSRSRSSAGRSTRDRSESGEYMGQSNSGSRTRSRKSNKSSDFDSVRHGARSGSSETVRSSNERLALVKKKQPITPKQPDKVNKRVCNSDRSKSVSTGQLSVNQGDRNENCNMRGNKHVNIADNKALQGRLIILFFPEQCIPLCVLNSRQ